MAETTTNVARLQNITMRENNITMYSTVVKEKSYLNQIHYIQSMLQTIAIILFLDPHYKILWECFFSSRILMEKETRASLEEWAGRSPPPLSQRVEPPMGGLFEEFLSLCLCLGDTLGSTSVLIWLSPVTLIKHSLGDAPWSCLKAATDPFIIVWSSGLDYSIRTFSGDSISLSI